MQGRGGAGLARSPLTNGVLQHLTLVPNSAVQEMIDREFQAAKQDRDAKREEARRLLDRELKDLEDEEDLSSILEGMRRYREDPEVQAVLCSSLAKLTIGNDKNRVLVAAHGGIDDIVAAMVFYCQPS